MMKKLEGISDTRRAFLAAAFSPFALIFGFIAAFIPFAIWQDFRETDPNLPAWFNFLVLALAYSLLAPTVLLGTVWSLQALFRKNWVALLPLAWFCFLITWQFITLFNSA
jgi:hypothetical protein